MKIDVRGAVLAAKKYFEDIQDMIGNSINDILLEEVELSENKRFWYVIPILYEAAYNGENKLDK